MCVFYVLTLFFVQKIEMEILHKIRDSILHQERTTINVFRFD